jgi:hypothetical protein
MHAIVVTMALLARRKIRPATICNIRSEGRQNPGKQQRPDLLHRSHHGGGAEEEINMNASMILIAATAIATSVTFSAAQAGSWTTHWTGPSGGVYEGSGSCANGACQSAGTFTGPRGGVWRHSGDAHQIAPGQWAGNGKLVGPAGGTWQHSWTWHAGSN